MESTRQITKAMELVASSKIRKANRFYNMQLKLAHTARIVKVADEILKNANNVIKYPKEKDEIDLELETFGAELNDKAKVDENGLITLPVPNLNGYDFKGWFYDPYYQNSVSNLKQSDYNNETLYAKFELNDELYLTSFVLEKYEEHSSNYDVLTMFNSDSSGFASKYWHKIGVTKNGDDYYVSGIATSGTSLSELGSYDYIILGYSSYPLFLGKL